MVGLMQAIAQPHKPLDFHEMFSRSWKRQAGAFSTEEKKKIEEEERVIQEKLDEVEKDRKPIKFFIPPIDRLCQASK